MDGRTGGPNGIRSPANRLGEEEEEERMRERGKEGGRDCGGQDKIER